MNPDRTNYEIWLIDYLDGILDNDRINQLSSFLNENPDIKEEFDDLLTFRIRPATGLFKQKKILKKTVSDLSIRQFEYLCISAAENDLSEAQRTELETFMTENPEKRKTIEVFKRLKLVAPQVKYIKKSGLKKLTLTQKIIGLSAIGLSAAAGITIMILLFSDSFNPDNGLKELISTRLQGDSNSLYINKKVATINFITAKNLEIPDAGSINVPGTHKKVIAAEKNAFQPDVAGLDSSVSNIRIAYANISKIDVKRDIILGEKEFRSTLAAINKREILPRVVSEKPGFNEFIAKILRERVLKYKTPVSGSLKAYEVADAGILGLNKLLGWQMSLQKNCDVKGDLKSLYFSSKILKFNAPIKKAQLAL